MTGPSEQKSAQPSGAPGGRRLRLAAGGIFLFLAFLLLFAAMAPRLLSSGPGRSLVEGLFNSRVTGALSLESLSLRWTSGQSVKGVVLRDGGGRSILTIDVMENDSSLWGLLKSGGGDLGTTAVSGLQADLAVDDGGQVNLMTALAPPGGGGGKKPGAVPVLPFGTLRVTDSRVAVSAEGMETVDLLVEELELVLPDYREPARLKLTAVTRQGDLSGDLAVDGTVEHAVGPEGRLQPLAAKADITVTARNLPVDGVDRAAGYRGQLAAALGRSLDLEVRTMAALEGVRFAVVAAAPNLEADVKLALTPRGVELTEKTDLRFILTPLFVRTVARVQDPGSSLDLAGEVPLHLRLAALRFPLGGFDPAGVHVEAGLKAAGDLRFRGIEGTGEMTVRSLAAALESPGLSERVTLGLYADLLLDGQAGRVRIDGELRKLFGADGRFLPQKADVDVKGELLKVPTVVLERLLGQPGELLEILGPTVDAVFDSKTSEGGPTDLDISLDSGRFAARAALIVADDVRLTRPAKIRATVTPRLARRYLAGGSGVTFPAPFEVSLNLSRLVLPLPEEGGPSLQADGAVLEGNLTAGRVLMDQEGIGRISLGEVDLSLRAESLKDVRIDGKGTVDLPGEDGLFASLAGGEPLGITFAARTGVGPEGRLQAVDGSLSLKNSGLETSAAFHVSPAFAVLTLASPLEATWRASAKAVEKLFPLDGEGYAPRGPFSLGLSVSSLEVPLREFALEKVKLAATGKVPELELSRKNAAAALLTEVKVKVDFSGPANKLTADLSAGASLAGEKDWYPLAADLAVERFIRGGGLEWAKAALALSVKSEGLPTALAGLMGEGGSRLETLAGKRMDVEASFRLEEIKGGRGEAVVKIKSPRLRLAADLDIAEAVTLRSPLEFQLTLTPEAYAALLPGGEGEGGFALAEPSVLKGRVTALVLPRSGGGPSPAGASFDLSAAADGMVFRDGESGRSLGLKDVALSAVTGDLSKGLKLGFEGKLSSAAKGGGAGGSIKGSAEVKSSGRAGGGWDGASLTVDLQGVGVPTALARIFTTRGEMLETLAGERMDLQAALRLSPIKGGTGEVRIVIKAPRLDLAVDSLLGETISLREPAAFRLTLTPEGYRALTDLGGEKGEKRFDLAEMAELKGRIETLQWPRKGGTGRPLAGVALKASIETERLLFGDGKKGGKVGLGGVSFKVEGADLGSSVKVGLKGMVIASGSEAGGSGAISLDSVITDLFDGEGRLNGGNLSLKVDGSAEKVPVALVDEWLGLGGMGEAALGESLDADVTVDLKKGSGPLNIRVKATGASLDVDAVVRKGVLGLNKPVVGILEVTDLLGSQLLSKIHPLFETVYTSSEPLRVEIPEAGFSLPLADFDIGKAVVPVIKVSSNKLVLRKGGLLDVLIVISQQFGGMKGVGGGETELWFTDIVADIKGGVLSYSRRLDLLIDNRLHAISWGTVSLAAKGEEGGKSSYELKLGLPADALRKVLGTERIGEGEVLVIPLEGTEGGLNAKSITSRGVLDLGRVRGQYELSKTDPLIGIIAGQIAKRAIGTDPGYIPPPSMTPLPWAHLMEPEPAPEATTEKGQETSPPEPAPRQKEEPSRPSTTEDVIREVLPDELKGVFDILRKK